MSKIKIYTTPLSLESRRLKQFLEGKKADYEDIDVDIDEAAKEKAIQKTGQLRFPVIEINNRFIAGFEVSKIKKEMKKWHSGK